MNLREQVQARLEAIALRAIRDWQEEELVPDLAELEEAGDRLEPSDLPSLPESFDSDELTAYLIGFVELQRIGNLRQLDEEEVYQICRKRLVRKDCSTECTDFLAGDCHGAFEPEALFNCVAIGIIKSSGQFVKDPTKGDDEDFHEVLNV